MPIGKGRIELLIDGEVEGVFDDEAAVIGYLNDDYAEVGKTFALNIMLEPIEGDRVRASINGEPLGEFANRAEATRFIDENDLRLPSSRRKEIV